MNIRKPTTGSHPLPDEFKSAQTISGRPATVIAPAQGWVSLELGQLWEYYELLYFLTWRDIKVRYKQTVLGGAWAIIQPFFTMVVFSIFFGQLAGIPSDGVPYPIFAYCALVPWQYFANALSQSSNSLVLNEGVITKVYFPRLIVPMAAILAGLVDFGLAFVILLAMMLWYGIMPTLAILALPLFVLLATAAALGVGLWLSALNVRYRDVRYVIPFLVQFWLFATPIAYPSSLVPANWQLAYGLNPMVGVVEGFRWALLGYGHAPSQLLAVAVLVVLVLLVSGLYYFRRMEETFADVV
ncbi:MAG TPA: ABC transporter permease [Roseiflexaceae bacterium]|nr:ABC transporter permease [Roseiflexaceae bacterium]